MHESSARSQNSKLRIAAIPVLAVVLLWTLLGPKGNSETDSPAIAAPNAGAAPVPAAIPARSKHAVTLRHWPSFRMEETLLHNPFTFSGVSGTLDTHASTAEQAAAQTQPPQPSVLAVSVYLASREGAVALVDGRILREGDLLDDGRRVAKLTPEFAVLEPAP